MRKEIDQFAVSTFLPSVTSAFVFFICLTFIWSGAAHILMSAITAFYALPFIFVFCLIGKAIIDNTLTKNQYINVALSLLLGALFGFIGYLIANYLGGFDSTIIAFLFSGVTAGFMVYFNSTANK